MSLPVVFRRAARAEFDAAADFYEARGKGLGRRFTLAVERVIDRAASQPDFYPVALDDVREAIVPSFPYCVYYRAEPGRVVVLSVFHTSRNPAVWQGRA